MSSVSDASSALSDLNEDDEAKQKEEEPNHHDQEEEEEGKKQNKTRVVPSGRRGHDAFGSLIDDW